MINENNENNEFEGGEFDSQSNVPQQNEKTSTSSTSKLRDKLPEGAQEKFKEYGKKSLSPLLELMHKYRDDITPYASALSKGLEGAVSALNSTESSEQADRTVAGWFSEVSEWFDGAREKLEAKDAKELVSYMESQAQASPGLMFSTSYVAGLIFGRLGRHIGRIKKDSSSPASSEAIH